MTETYMSQRITLDDVELQFDEYGVRINDELVVSHTEAKLLLEGLNMYYVRKLPHKDHYVVTTIRS